MSIDKFVSERNAALTTLDMDYGRRMMRGATDDVVLLAMHKARYDCIGIKEALRHQSRAWLEERGYRRIGGLAFPENRLELPK